MTLGIWIAIAFIVILVLVTVVAFSSHLKEDKVWRWLLTIGGTVIQAIIFGGAYFAGKQGWWWMFFLFLIVNIFTLYEVIVPDE
ncbi:MAG TPA: hypothetical protein DDW36_02150 [Candidatus Magasanikbacteria bacterium]|nr:hypothetical protein [Candidatus Magasanikbacteria bacterium]